MSEREYAARSGLSRGAIQKARKSGRLVVHADGSIDAAASDARRAGMTDPDQQRRSVGGDRGFSGPDKDIGFAKSPPPRVRPRQLPIRIFGRRIGLRTRTE